MVIAANNGSSKKQKYYSILPPFAVRVIPAIGTQ